VIKVSEVLQRDHVSHMPINELRILILK